MIKPLLEVTIVLLGSVWLIYKFFKSGEVSLLVAAGVVICLQLSGWPFYLPLKLILALIGLISAASSIGAFMRHRELKLFLTLGIILVFLSLAFLADLEGVYKLFGKI